MSSRAFTVLFVDLLVASLLVRFWLASRYIRHILAHANVVPAQFVGRIPLDAHRRAAAYTIAKTKLTLFIHLLIGFTLLGGLQWLSVQAFDIFGSGYRYQLAVVLAFALISGLVELPFANFRQFVLEARFGFNRMTPALFLTDTFKSSVISLAIGLGLVWIVLILMDKSGDCWWSARCSSHRCSTNSNRWKTTACAPTSKT